MIGILGGSDLILRLLLGHPHLPSVAAVTLEGRCWGRMMS